MALTVTAGNPATAAQYNALIPTYLLQGSDQALATTTFTNHNTFAAIPFAADTTYHCTCVMSTYAAVATDDIKAQWLVTGGSAISQIAQISQGTDAVSIGTTTFSGLVFTSGTTTSAGCHTSATYGGLLRFEFIVVTTGAAGTVTLQWAQNLATSGTTTVEGGSFFVAHRLV